MDIYEGDTGKFLGRIRQIGHTYTVLGDMNEHQVAIGETTFSGRTELQDPTGVIDYGSLMLLGLQRGRTARQAIEVMGALVAEYGYYSTGETFSVSDPNEVWIMEIIGKGPGNTGAVWVARRIPDGYVSAHANQSRIRQFPLNDPKNCLYAQGRDLLRAREGVVQGPGRGLQLRRHLRPGHLRRAALLRGAGLVHVPPGGPLPQAFPSTTPRGWMGRGPCRSGSSRTASSPSTT